MNHRDFGKLVAALRKSWRQPYTQAGLARQTGLTEAVIGKVERGEKLSADPDLLLRLAQAFSLSTRERREFFLAAIGLEEDDLPAQRAADDKTLTNLLEVLRQTALPAFIVDAYDDILAANHIILSLFDFSAGLRQAAPGLIGGYNVLRFVFSSRSLFSQQLGGGQSAYLRQSIAFFRAISLPVRATPYYRRLVECFLKESEMAAFQTFFYEPYPQDDFSFEGIRFDLQHPTLGALTFFSPPIFPVATSQGNLTLIAYLPASAATLQACARLTEASGPGFVRLAAWLQK